MSLVRRFVAILPALLLFTSATQAQVQQGAAAAGTLTLANVPAAAREAVFAAIDARQIWSFQAAHELANRALSIDSTLGLARLTRVDLAGGATAAAANAEYERAVREAAARPAGEATYLIALRATGVNSNRLLATARQMLPNDRRVALDHALSYIGDDRLDSLRSLVRQHPDFLAPRLWLAYWLAISPYSVSPAQIYEGLTVAEGAVRLAPNVAATHAALGWVLRAQGRLDEAAAHNVAATKLDPRNEVAYSNLALIYVRDGKPRGVDRSRMALDSAIAFSPNLLRQINYRRERAFLLFYDGRKAEGLAELASVAKEYETAAPGTAAVVYSQMAGLAAGTGDSAKVEGYAAEARRVAPNADVTVQLAQAYALNKQGAAARRELGEYIRRAPDTTTAAFKSNVRRLEGMTLVAEGKAAEGIKMLQNSDIPSNTFADVSMADAHMMLGNKAEANALLTAVATRKNGFNSGISAAIAAYRTRKK